jgi:hypothetical protein
MLIAFFNVKGIVHREFVLPNTTVNCDFNFDVLKCLRKKCATKKPEPLAQPQLAPSSQCARPHVPENHRVCG